jgi:hypothetical protein
MAALTPLRRRSKEWLSGRRRPRSPRNLTVSRVAAFYIMADVNRSDSLPPEQGRRATLKLLWSDTTGGFLTRSSKWTTDPTRAKVFEGDGDAARAAQRLDLKDAQVYHLFYEDRRSEYDSRFPVQSPAAKPPTPDGVDS